VGGDGRAFAGAQVFEVQVADEAGGVDDGHSDARFLRGRIQAGHAGAASAKVFHAADSRQRRREAVNAVADVGGGVVRPLYVAREVGIGGAAAAAGAPPAQAAVLLVALDLAVRADDFVALVDRPLEAGRGDPVIVEGDAQAVGEVNPHLHRVVGIDAVTHQPPFLADGRERDRLAPVVVVN